MHRPVPTLTPVPWAPVLPCHPSRAWAARHLRRTSAWLRRLARWLQAPPTAKAVPQSLPRIEFHAEAGAPEGALYVDGEYIGRLDVRRL